VEYQKRRAEQQERFDKMKEERKEKEKKRAEDTKKMQQRMAAVANGYQVISFFLCAFFCDVC
jgi:hypothetical protein